MHNPACRFANSLEVLEYARFNGPVYNVLTHIIVCHLMNYTFAGY